MTTHETYVLGYEPLRQAGVPCPFEQRAVGAEQIKGRKIAWVSPRSEANALQQLAGIEFMFRAQPERAAEALHQLAEPPDNVCVFDVPEQLEDNSGIAHLPGLYALRQPRAARRLASPVTPLGAVFAVYIFRFVLVHTIYLQTKKPGSSRTVRLRICIKSALRLALSAFLPLLQKLDDGLLHLLRRVGARKVFAQPVAGDGDAVYLRLLLLGHDRPHDSGSQLSAL